MGISGSVERPPIQTLVLGCMAAGKSTFIKQMIKTTRARNYRREPYRSTIQLNLLNVYREIRALCQKFEISTAKYDAAFDLLAAYRHKEDMKEQHIDAIREINKSGLIEACRLRLRILPLPQNYAYFLENTEEFTSPNYVPSEEDIIKSYAQTCGLNRETVACNGFKFELLEMPGHHIWRRRWVSHFDEPDLVVFVIDLSELCDPAFYEGHLENKTITIFRDLVNNPILAKVYWLLLFNKNDTFDDHSAGFDFKRLASHLDTADSARSYYRSEFTTLLPKLRCFAHMVSLTNFRESQALLSDMFGRIARIYREERQNML